MGLKYMYRGQNWNLDGLDNFTWDRAQLGVLMDIRDELKRLNNLLHCENFQRIPRKLDRISANTAKPKKVRKTTSDNSGTGDA